MHVQSEPAFLATKKQPAPAGDDEGWINPSPKGSWMYCSIASVLGLEREERQASVVSCLEGPKNSHRGGEEGKQ